MIALVAAMLWHRRGQAVTLALLALFAVAAAVAAPAYLQATDRAVAAGQVETAAAGDRGLVVTKVEDDRAGSQASGDGNSLSFSTVGPALVRFPGFTNVYAAEYPTVGIEPDLRYRSRFVYRQDACAHLTMATGRCLIGAGEVVLGERTAQRLALGAGDHIELSYAQFSSDPRTPVFEAHGRAKGLTVVGTYRVPHPADAYWGTHGYFAADPGDRPGEPVFTNSATLNAMDHGSALKSVDGTAGPGALDVDRLAGVRAALAGLRDVTAKLGSTVTVRTGLPDLLARIDSGRAAARLIVPVVAVPLVALSWFAIFLAVGYGTEGRRPELAVVALRGARRRERWWLATGESLVAILAGAVAGCLAGQLLVNVAAALLFPGVGAAPGAAALRYAPLAAAGAVLAALLAQRRQLFSPVAQLLRRAPVAGRRPPILEAAVALLAVVTGVQLSLSGGSPTGAGLFAPALIVFAIALLSARALLPIVTRLAARALRRGQVGLALAGLQLSRRPGAQGLFSLLVAAVAVTTYAAGAVDSGAQDRAAQAELGTGADRVVSIAPVTPGELLGAVREIDRDGRFAMAVARTPSNAAGEPPGLAVDATRLAAVATWPGDGPPAGRVAAALHPSAPEPVVIPGRDVTVEAMSSGLSAQHPLNLTVSLTSVSGRGSTRVSLGQLRPGPFAYTQRVPSCAGGCRLDGIQITSIDATSGISGHLTITRLGSINPVADAVGTARLGDRSQWRMTAYGGLTAAPGGLGIDIDAPAGLGDSGAWIQPVDTPYPLPVATAGSPGDAVTGLDGRRVDVTRAVRLPAVPRLGVRATLVDLEYADRAATAAAPAAMTEVWLSAAAPSDILDQLAAHGLVVTGDVSATVARAQLDRQGPALALAFYALAGGLAVLLGAGALVLAAAVDRQRRAEDLSALRVQGLDRRSAGRATLWAYPMLVVIAVPAGLLTGLAGYGLTGWALPLAGLDPPPLPLPLWPRPAVVAAVAVPVLLVLAGVAVLTSRNLRNLVAGRTGR
ncbi:hypothetical protein COUCH_11810 [Couchioplanes caeruleus]|uniref:FtsX-like permease family protein n=1 Tax=Couchioplanes caeruleus TaxID=56438 RepID=UPI0020C0F3D2|nr:FtsX-like permease family protein [Couchioplanes caeruleus]UQU66907.1 hypothetical protein COUCH_11810 [Couchioplanes caeruleus]